MTTDSTFAKLVEAMTALQTARTSVVSTHRRLDTIREALGLRTVAGLSPNKIDTDGESNVEASVARLRA
jgi:hypothetical protein